MNVKGRTVRQRFLIAGLVTLATAVASSRDICRGEDPAKPAPTTQKDPPGLIRLSPKFDVWTDKQNKRVVTVGEICLREGQMEMFACLRHTKEHESIIAVPIQAQIVHAAL